MNSLVSIAPLCLLALSSIAVTASADWRVDAGYSQLQIELGAAMPTGAGIAVLQSEASDIAGPTLRYLPQATAGSGVFAGAGSFAGKSFTPHSGASDASGHAQSVAGIFYSLFGSVAPGVTEVHVYEAGDFFSSLYTPSPPPVFAGSVQNHSWVGSTGNDATDTEFLRRLDYIIERDGITATVPLNNGTAMPKLPANGYHTISVGMRSGGHSVGGSTLDGVGRMKPDLVVDQGFTSYASPAVASAATLLLDAIRPDFADADDPRIVKAILLAAATKERLPTWHRTASTKPYDATFGAGELNVLNAYHILAAGDQPASASSEVGTRGWDGALASSATPKRWFFSVPVGRIANSLSVAATWHRVFSSGVSVAALPHLTLRLFASTGFTLGSTPVDQSNSAVDNVQHLFLRHLPAGQYALELASDTNNVPVAIAWEAQLGSGPVVSVVRSGNTATLSFSGLDPFASYTVEASANLTSWTAATTFRTADTTPSQSYSWQDNAATGVKFYRLAWASVR